MDTQRKKNSEQGNRNAAGIGNASCLPITPAIASKALRKQGLPMPTHAQQDQDPQQSGNPTTAAGSVKDLKQLLERMVLEINTSHKLILSLCERVEKAMTLILKLRQTLTQEGDQEHPDAPEWGDTLHDTLYSIHTFATYVEKVCDKAQIAIAITRSPRWNSDKEMVGDPLSEAKQNLAQPPANTSDSEHEAIYTSALEIWAALEMQKMASREVRLAIEELQKALA